MWCLRFRWSDETWHLTKSDNVELVQATDSRVRLFPTEEAARQYLRYAFGVKCDLYPAYVGKPALRRPQEVTHG